MKDFVRVHNPNGACTDIKSKMIGLYEINVFTNVFADSSIYMFVDHLMILNRNFFYRQCLWKSPMKVFKFTVISL